MAAQQDYEKVEKTLLQIETCELLPDPPHKRRKDWIPNREKERKRCRELFRPAVRQFWLEPSDRRDPASPSMKALFWEGDAEEREIIILQLDIRLSLDHKFMTTGTLVDKVYPPEVKLDGRKDWTPRTPERQQEEMVRHYGEQITDYLDAYLETALWSSTDESDPETGGEPLDKNYTTQDIVPDTMEKMLNDAFSFLEQNHNDIGDRLRLAGHDFWLTRNGHGAGFWDGDWPEPAASRLTRNAQQFGEITLIVGDDGKIHAL